MSFGVYAPRFRPDDMLADSTATICKRRPDLEQMIWKSFWAGKRDMETVLEQEWLSKIVTIVGRSRTCCLEFDPKGDFTDKKKLALFLDCPPYVDSVIQYYLQKSADDQEYVLLVNCDVADEIRDAEGGSHQFALVAPGGSALHKTIADQYATISSGVPLYLPEETVQKRQETLARNRAPGHSHFQGSTLTRSHFDAMMDCVGRAKWEAAKVQSDAEGARALQPPVAIAGLKPGEAPRGEPRKEEVSEIKEWRKTHWLQYARHAGAYEGVCVPIAEHNALVRQLDTMTEHKAALDRGLHRCTVEVEALPGVRAAMWQHNSRMRELLMARKACVDAEQARLEERQASVEALAAENQKLGGKTWEKYEAYKRL